MERLEAALEKARKERQQTSPSDAGPANTARMPRNEPVDETWAAVKEFKITTRLARNNRITTLAQGRESGPYDLLRTRALRIMNDNGWHRLAITSPNKSCGKTTVSTNLAISLARQSDLRIIALDLDLRRPAMHKIIGQRTQHSLHEYLSGQAPMEDAFLRLGENLIFGINKSAAENPSELLQSRQARLRIDEIQEKYQPDILIFDLPPMLVSDENVGFLPIVDTGLLVGAADSTTIAQLDICEKELAELTNVLGIILNKCRFTDNEAGYDYDYY